MIYFKFFFIQVAFGIDIDVIGGKDTKFRDAVSLSFQGADVANLSVFHKVFNTT